MGKLRRDDLPIRILSACNYNLEVDHTETDKLRQRVEELLRQGFLDRRTDSHMRVGTPLPVMHPEGGQHSWFVPLEVGNKLAGFAQMLMTLEPLRFSGFQRVSGNLDECPDTADWTAPDRILSRAATLAKPDERLSAPVLTYELDPSRLVWRIKACLPSGSSRSLFVAGTAVYDGSDHGGWGSSSV